MNEPTQPKWPHLENIDKQPAFLEDAEWITVTEKIHGMNVRFGKTPDGTFWVGSRNNVVFTGPPLVEEAMTGNVALQGFTRWALTRMADTPVGYTFFGEWAGKGIQKGIDYGEKRLFLFGASKYKESSYGFLDWRTITNWAKLLQVDTAPILYDGPWPSMEVSLDMMEKWRKTWSLVSPKEEVEGICITAWPMASDRYGNPLIIKWKNPKFAEIASARKDKKPPADLTNVQPFVDEYATMERLEHVLSRVGEELDDESDPLDRKYTGDVLRTYYEDVIREGFDIYGAMSEDDQRLVGKALNKAVKPMLDEMRTTAVMKARDAIIDYEETQK